jgi:hypothetical protein
VIEAPTSQNVKALLRAPKDSALSFAVRTAFNRRFHAIGEVTELSVNTKAQAVRLQLRLAGEVEPVSIRIRKFAVRRKGNRSLLGVVDASASRKWFDAALREFVVGHSFAIPKSAATALELLT